MAYCIHCGRQLVEGARFCAFCGKEITASRPSAEAERIIAYVRDYLCLAAEPAEDGGVRITGMLDDGDPAVQPMMTPSGFAADGLILPEGVTEIGERAFYGCCELDYIELPASLRKIGQEAFDSSHLLEVVIPEGVREIGSSVFHDCFYLRKATVACPIRVLTDGLFMACDELEEVILPSTLEEIEEEAFEQCPKLRHLTLPARLTKVAPYAFLECHPDIIRQVRQAYPAYKG